MGGNEGGRPQGTPWSRGALGLTALLILFLLAAPTPRAGAQGGGSGVQIFGPKEYVRTTGAPNQYTDTFAVPSWTASPFTLHVQNGDPSGSNRISSATITINGTQVAGPSDFNQNVAGFDRTVTLTAQTTLHVSLASKPGSFLILNLGGASADHTAPAVAVAMPANGRAVNTATPSLDVTYSDAGSGVDTSTLAVTLDGADRTSLFTRRPTDASATLPASLSLAPGAHVLTATIQDNAGNAGTATSHFTVDLAPPHVQVVAPAAGSYLATATPAIHVAYGDDAGLDLATLKVLVNGVDRTALFAKTATDATATLTASTALPQGANQIVAQIADAAGNVATDAAAFNVDLTAPAIAVASPASGARFGDGSVPVSITYHDDQAIDPGSLQVKLDGHAVALTAGPDSASGTVAGVADGSHTLTVHVADRAGNAANATVSFVVDTAVPTIQVTAPAAGAFVSTGSPAIAIAYSDPDAVATASFKVLLNGVDRTSLFTVGPTGANAALAGHLTLADGAVTVSAQVANLAGKVGSTTSTFTVDTAPPTVAVTAPTGAVASAAPAATVAYSDAGSGIDTASVHVLLDGADVTGLFALTSTQAVGTLSVDPPLADGAHTLAVTVADRAGNPKTASSAFTVDTAPPTATFAAPADNAFLNTPTPALELDYGDPASDGAGSGVDTTKIHVFLAHGSDPETEITSYWSFGAAKGTGQIPAASPLADATYHLRAALQDRAGNAATARATFEVDTVRPTYQIVQPALASVLSTRTPAIVVAYQDDASGVDTARLKLRIDGVDESALLVAGPDQATATLGAADALADGTHSVEVTVVDRAGNQAPIVPQSFTVDTGAPTIQATAAPPPNAAGWNDSPVTVTFTCGDGGSTVATCPPPVTVSTAGAGQVVSGTAVDAAGNSATASVTLSIDLTPPAIAQLATPAQLAPDATAPVSLTATDDVAIASVVFQVNGTTAATLTAPPFQFDLAVPAGVQAGDTLTVTAVVADLAGNTATASRGVAVVGRGVVVGQVLADATGLPLLGADVQVVGGTGADVSDEDGRYSIPVSQSHLFLRIAMPADSNAGTPEMLPVEREVSVQSGVGTVPIDSRLTAVAGPVAIDSGGGTLTAGSVRVDVPGGAVAAATPFHLTPLSGQGLPNLLPLGWSPVAAFDLRADAATSGALGATVAQLPPGPLQLVVYDLGLHAWTMVAPDLAPAGGALAVSLPAPGAYALVVADADPALVVPDPGQPLPGTDMVLLPPDAASSGALAPPSLSPAGGTATATLAVSSSVPLPSGTVIQANVTESYTLASGDQLSSPARAEDLVLYRYAAGSGVPAGAALAAAFPVTPSESFAVADLQSGKVHLDILAGRESVRGETGGASATVVQDGDATLALAAGSLPEDTAVDLVAEPLATFLPAGNGLTPLAQYAIDLGGETLALAAQLSDAAGSAQPGDSLLLARVQRFGGVPRLVAVALAQVSGGRIAVQPYPGLPGITVGGEYVFYKLAQPVGFVAGRVSVTGGGGGGVAAGALVSTAALPFVAPSDAAGQYTIPALPGTASVQATVPQTALVASGSVAVTAGQTAALDLVLSGAVTAATVNPADGAVGVDPTAGITVLAADALNPATATAANVQLFQVTGAGNQPVAVRFVLAQGNRQLSIFPLAALQPSTRYLLQVTGLATAVGGLVAVPSVTFTTRSVTPPNFNPDALVFAFPDANGNVQVSAPASSFPAGSKILIVDQTNGVVLTLTVGNDGAVSGQLPATIDDVLLVTVTAPDKSTATFTRTQFVAPDGSVAVGSAGGTVTGPGGVELRIPAGALDKAVTLKLENFGPELFPERPDVPDGSFGSGLKVTSPDKLVFKKEVKLAFPKPADAPDGAFFYVYRRLATADGTVAFEVIDHAFVDGDKVVTASAPFPGFITGIGALQTNPATSALASGFEQDYFFQMWSFERLLVGVASQGVIVGKVLRTIPPGPGQAGPTYAGIPGAKVYLSDDAQLAGGASQPGKLAISQADGTFSLWDPALGGGTRKVTAVVGSETVEATAFEVDAAQPDPLYFPSVDIFRQYRNVGKVNLTFPPLSPPPPAPQVDIRLFTLDGNKLRVPVTGIVQSGTRLVVAFKSNATVKGATINSAPQTVVAPDVLDNAQDPLRLDARVTDLYTVGDPGLYTIVATAVPALGGPPLTASKSFLVVAPGGSNSSTTTGTAPVVLNTSPLKDAQGVATTIFPEIVFSEPVTHVPDNLMLAPDPDDPATLATPAAVRLIGVRADGTVANPVGANDAVTSVTVQPVSGLKYGSGYTLTLASGIIDQNQPPLALPTFTLRFTTFGPQELGGTSAFSSTRPVVIDKRAYLGKFVTPELSTLDVVDISDPSNPSEVGTGPNFVGRAIDVAGLALSPVTSGPLVAVAAGIGPIPLPSNLWLYDVSDPDHPARVGAVSATTSAAQDGALLRIAMKDRFVYASTFPKGLQVIDLQQAISDYQQARPTDFGQAITTEGQGFGLDAVVNTIPLMTNIYLPVNGQPCLPQVETDCQPELDTHGNVLKKPAVMFDLEAGDFAGAPDPGNPGVPGPTTTLVVATGQLPLVVADPEQAGPSAILYPPAITYAGLPDLSQAPLLSADGLAQLEQGRAVALGTLSLTDAQGGSAAESAGVVVGIGTVKNGGQSLPGKPLLLVVNLNDPRHPAVQGYLQLAEQPIDVVLKDSLALVGTGAGKVLLVSLADPAHPFDAGEIDGSFGDRLAISDSGVLVTSSVSSTIGGVHTALINPAAAIRQASPAIVHLDQHNVTMDPVAVDYQLTSPPSDATSGQLLVMRNQDVIATVPLAHFNQAGVFQVTVPAGLLFDVPDSDVTMTVQRPDGSTTNPMHLLVKSPDSPALAPGQGGSLLPAATFTALSPSRAPVGSADTVVTITGSNMDKITSAFVRGVDGSWLELTTSANTPTQAQVTIPGALMASAGFLELSPLESSEFAVAFMVFTPGLPALGTAPEIAVAQVNPADIGTGGFASVMGGPFAAGVQAVIGRANVPGVVLPTTVVDDTTLTVQLPDYIAANDLFIAILSADGRLSPAFPVSSSFPELESDLTLDEPDPDADARPVEITSTSGDLVWNGGDQTLVLQGTNLQAGMQVTFTTSHGQFTATTAPLSLRQQSSSTLPQTRVTVPHDVTDHPDFSFQIQLLRGAGGTTGGKVSSPPFFLRLQPNYYMPLGGLGRFIPYYDPLSKRIELMQQGAVRPARLRFLFGLQPLNNVIWTLPLNVRNSQTGLLSVDREKDASHPESLYLRANHLSSIIPSVNVHADATVGQQFVHGDFALSVIKGSIGSASTYDDFILKSADQFGVPPQFLKSQANRESHLFDRYQNYRYEPATIDFQKISSNGSETFLGGQRRIENPEMSKYAIGGSILASPLTAHPRTFSVSAQGPPLGPDFMLGGPVAAYEDIPGSGRPIIDAKITSADGKTTTPLTFVTATCTWTKSGMHGSAKSHGAFYYGQTTQPTGSGANHGPGPTEFSVDFATGKLTLGRQLNAGETLTVTFTAVQGAENVVPVTAGKYQLSAAQMNERMMVTPQFSQLQFRPGESLSDWFADNFNLNSIDFQYGVFLTGTSSEKELNFTATPDPRFPAAPNAPQQCRPVKAFDGRYTTATAQFVAAASFGPVHMTIQNLDDSTYGLPLLAALNNGGEKPMFNSLTDIHLGLDLGAAFHKTSLKRRGGNSCEKTICTKDDWKAMWSRAFKFYGAPIYDGVPSEVIMGGDAYEPK